MLQQVMKMGVSLLTSLKRGASSDIQIITGAGGNCQLNGWVDFNQDGSFTGADEHVLVDQFQAVGSTETYPVDIPLNAKSGDTYARFRCSSSTGLEPTGSAPDGEVEDYAVSITNPIPNAIPTLGEWGLMLLMMLISWFAYTQRFAIKKS